MAGYLQATGRLANGSRASDDYQRLTQWPLLSDDAARRFLNERAYILHLFRVGVLGTGFGHTFLHDAMTIDDTVGIVDGLNGLVAESATTQANEVHTRIADRLLASNDVWRDIHARTTTTLNHHVAANIAELVEQTGG